MFHDLALVHPAFTCSKVTIETLECHLGGKGCDKETD